MSELIRLFWWVVLVALLLGAVLALMVYAVIAELTDAAHDAGLPAPAIFVAITLIAAAGLLLDRRRSRRDRE